MSKITKYVACTVAAAMLEETYVKKEKEANKKLAELGDKIYKELFTTQEHNFMKTAVQQWFGVENYITLYLTLPDEVRNAEGDYVRLNIKFNEAKRVPRSMSAHSTIDEKHPLYKKLLPLALQINEVADYRVQYARIEQVLLNFGTVKKAVEGWPECEKYLIAAGISNGSEGKAVALVASELNKSLGLPVTE